MKANTVIHMGIRNIGDANDSGQYFEGMMKDSILWMAAQLSQMHMKKSIAIGIGRSKADVMARLDLKKGPGTQAMLGLQSMLDELMADSSAERDGSPTGSELESYIEPRDPKDDYVP